MARVCRYCILYRGIRGSDLANFPQTDKEFATWIGPHIEAEHHIPVRRNNETIEQCKVRFAREQPDAGGPNCKCPKCEALNMLLTK
jgi:hypothetical protein